MAWAPDYCTLAELKSALAINDTADDDELGFAITAASRAIDHAAGRQFGLIAAAAARYYGAEGTDHVAIDDLMSTTDLAVAIDRDGDGTFDETLVLDTDVRLHPWNAAAEGRPWTSLRTIPRGAQLPTNERGVRVTAIWGWSAVPTAIKQACLTQAGRLFKRKDSPFGIAGSPELGNEVRLLSKLDPDVAVLVSVYARKDGEFG